MFTPTCILVFVGFAVTLFSGITGRVPLWIAVLLLNIAMLIGCLR